MDDTFHAQFYTLNKETLKVLWIYLKLNASDGPLNQWPWVVKRTPQRHFDVFSSETTGPIEAKFHVEPPWGGGTKICWNGLGQTTKMAAKPIYGKNFKTSSPPEPCSIRCSSNTKFIQMMILAWPWPILRQGQIWSLMLLYGKKVKQ